MIKVFVISEKSFTETAESEVGHKVCPSGKKWTILEIRPYFSRAVTENMMYLYRETEQIAAIHSLSVNTYKRPYPMDTVVVAGEEVRVTAKTDGLATELVMEIIVSEESA